jgi:hypothetical protein
MSSKTNNPTNCAEKNDLCHFCFNNSFKNKEKQLKEFLKKAKKHEYNLFPSSDFNIEAILKKMKLIPLTPECERDIDQFLSMRMQMVDWMVIVSASLKLRDETFFLAIDILDKVIIKFNYNLSDRDLHLISIISIFLASKYQEVVPIDLKLLLEKVAHNKFTKEDILAGEILILKKLNFKMPSNYFLDYTYSLMDKIFGRNLLCLYRRILFVFLKFIYKLSLSDMKLTRGSNLKDLYTAIFSFGINYINEYLNDKSHNFNKEILELHYSLKINARYINKLTNYIENLFSIFLDNKASFTYLYSCEFQIFSSIDLSEKQN